MTKITFWGLVLGTTLATTLPLKGEGGLLLYNTPGTPFAECVRYKSLLTPREGLIVAVKPKASTCHTDSGADDGLLIVCCSPWFI